MVAALARPLAALALWGGVTTPVVAAAPTAASASPAGPAPAAVAASRAAAPLREAASERSDGLLAARLAPGASANEYWDVTVWLDSGERFFARFLVTNEGPGERTAAAVGHLVETDGRNVQFKWGRREGAWSAGDGGRVLSIGKATLDVTDAGAAVVRIDSKKHGIDLRLAIERRNTFASFGQLAPAYAVAASMPDAARATLNAGDPARRRALTGSGAIVHTWLDRPEGEIVRRRDELLARDGTRSLYATSLVLLDGTRRALVVAPDPAGGEKRAPGKATLVFEGAPLAGESGYPVAGTWLATDGVAGVRATLERERLRTNPLDVLPQPFRFLLSLGGVPRRIWTDATVAVAWNAAAAEVSPIPGEGAGREAAAGPGRVTDASRAPIVLHGVAVSTFARPEL